MTVDYICQDCPRNSSYLNSDFVLDYMQGCSESSCGVLSIRLTSANFLMDDDICPILANFGAVISKTSRVPVPHVTCTNKYIASLDGSSLDDLPIDSISIVCWA